MASTRLDLVLMKLSRYQFDPGLDKSRKTQLCELQMELRFLKMFFWCYENWDYTGNKNMNSDSFMSKFEVTSQEMAVDFEHWERFAHQLMEKMELFKPQFKEICFDLLSCSLLHSKYSTSDELNDFIVTILQNLEDLLGLKRQMIVPVKDQIEVLQQKLKLFGNLVKFSAERSFCDGRHVQDRVSKSIFGKLIDFHNVFPCFYFNQFNSADPENNFWDQVQGWTIKVASISFLYWVDNLEGETITKLNTISLDLLQPKKRRSPEAVRKFLGLLKEALVSIRSNTLLLGEVIASSIDMLLDDLIACMEDSLRMALHDGLIILIAFLIDPPERLGRNGNDICAKADALVDEAASLISSLFSKKENDCIPNARNFLKKIGILSSNEENDCIHNARNFLKKIDILKEEIKENYVQIQDLSWSEFPITNGLGFLDFLRENLKERMSSLPFAKCLLLELQEKLISIRPYLKDVMEQQSEFEETKVLCLRIIRVAYAVEHFVDSCFFEGNQIWHRMICLNIFLEDIEFLITEAEKIRDESVYKGRVPNVEMNPAQMIPKYAKTSRHVGAIVGFKNEAEAIFDKLMGGSKQLEMVSIVGMGGQGKTTLANKVYNDPSIKYHFHKLAWCFVSQIYEVKRLLVDILSDVTVLDREHMHEMSEGELAEKLYRCLKGQQYLIVLDDIWDIKAWHQLKESFPNDKNGSRILITSRIRDMASQTNLGSSTHLLCPLSAEESWELLQKKIFQNDACPKNLSDVGSQIVKLCEGLPLSIVLIAGVLARRVRDLNWWKEIATNLGKKILGEGCMNILDLSYAHLPEHLKPCFLYFGVFQQGKVVKVQKLIRLWVAEGFIPKNGTKEQEDVAEDFLMDLILRSLVIVVESSSNSGIKKCRIHDLLFDLCLAKIKQERFLCPLNDPQCPDIIDGQYRLNIHTHLKNFLESNPTALHARSLLFPHRGKICERFVSNFKTSSFLMSFKFLRVLDLLYGIFFYNFLEEINSLIHLRYLALGGDFLEPQIHSLLSLEVLCLCPSTFISVLPLTIWEMKRLRHIQLQSATHFYLGNTVLEVQVGTLDNVDTLSCPILCRNEYSEELLRRFPKIRKLRFLLYDYYRDCPQFPILDFLRDIESLNVLCHTRMDYSCGFQLPSTLKKLTLSRSDLPWSEISAIAKLPNLVVLKLLRALVGRTWDMEEEGFMKLRFLKLKGLNIQRWNSCSDPFPCLERLVLENCYELEEIPSDFGEISTLDMIEVHSCSEGAQRSAREIPNVQRDFRNDGCATVLITSGNDCRIYEDNKHEDKRKVITNLLKKYVFKSG